MLEKVNSCCVCGILMNPTAKVNLICRAYDLVAEFVISAITNCGRLFEKNYL